MAPGLTRPARLPPPWAAVATAVLAYLLLGTLGHDPWRSDDAIHLGIAYGFHAGQWLVPTLAGEPWLRSPPLYHWLAAIHGALLDGLLPWHDAARLASASVLGIGFLALHRAARALHGEDAGMTAPLLALGTLGLLVPAHEASPSLMAFTATALQLVALARWREHPALAGALLGTSLCIGFLGMGLSAAVPMLALAVLAMAHPHWLGETRHGWLVALAVSLPLAAAWPTALGQHNAGLLQGWWEHELAALGGSSMMPLRRLEFLAWASWPVLPLALWGLWLERRRLARPANYLMLAGIGVGLVFFLRAREATPALMPLLAALLLLASTIAGRLRRGAANAFDWFGAITLSLFMALVWLGGIAMLTGSPERVAKNFTKPAPGFIADGSWPALTLAVLATLLWLWLLVKSPRSPWRAASRWGLGVAVLWALLATLWLPWIDYGKSYRPVSAELRRALGKAPGCIERRNLGPAQRASLDYFNGIRTTGARNKNCGHLLVQTRPTADAEIQGWQLLLQTARPGDRSETLRLYRRAD